MSGKSTRVNPSRVRRQESRRRTRRFLTLTIDYSIMIVLAVFFFVSHRIHGRIFL